MCDKQLSKAKEHAMIRLIALQIAKMNYNAHMKADVRHMFLDGPAPNLSDYGTRGLGWYSVGNFNFNVDTLTGTQYDITQGGWSHL
jgi:hypothetical protein